MPGSPAIFDHSVGRRVSYFVIGIPLAITGEFLKGLLPATPPVIQGKLGLRPAEGGRLVAVYPITNL